MRKLTYDEFIQRLERTNKYYANGDLSVVGEYINRRTRVKCRCNIHDCIWDEFPETLYKGRSCPQCDGWYLSDIKLFGDRPSLWESRPDVARLLKNPDDGYRCTYGTIKKYEFVCPDCGNVILTSVICVSHNGLRCQKCSDGVSSPNKFSRALLDQLPIYGYVCEYHPDWAKPYFYDNYFEYMGKKYVLEMDGAYHYVEKSPSDKSLDERCSVDRLKDLLARQNGVEVIRINCLIAQADYIKEHIIQSRLTDIFDLSKIDWDLCEQKAQKNLLKEACKVYMEHKHTLVEIERLLHVGKDTLRRYLKTGCRFGWCDYDPEKNKTYPKSVVVFDCEYNIINKFYSIRETERMMWIVYGVKISRSDLVRACATNKLYKGFYFRLDNDNNIE